MTRSWESPPKAAGKRALSPAAPLIAAVLMAAAPASADLVVHPAAQRPRPAPAAPVRPDWRPMLPLEYRWCLNAAPSGALDLAVDSGAAASLPGLPAPPPVAHTTLIGAVNQFMFEIESTERAASTSARPDSRWRSAPDFAEPRIPVPLPPAVWNSLAVLAGIAAFGVLRRRSFQWLD